MADPGTRILILGGLGYLGARLAAELAREHEVVVTARSLSPVRQAWLDRFNGRVRAVPFDSARDRMPSIDGDFRCVINLASPGAGEAREHPERARIAAITSLQAAMALADVGRAGALLHFSSFHVYGSQVPPELPDDAPPRPSHPYGEMHAASEAVLRADGPAAPWCIVRPTNVLGAPAHSELGPQAGLIFFDLCKQALHQPQVTLRSNGEAYRDFVPMTSALDAVSMLLRLLDRGEATGRTVNLASGSSVLLSDLAHRIAVIASERRGRPIAVEFGNGLDPFRMPFRVQAGFLERHGWSCATDVGDEITQILAFFAAQR
jgi:nucleoside-diphosphate-sugar epimerase